MPFFTCNDLMMKTMRFRLLGLVSVLALAGCANVPAEFAARMDQAAERYATVTSGMSRSELVAALGAPQREDESSATWEMRFNRLNYDSLAVEFNREGRVAKITLAHGRATRGPAWSSARSHGYEERRSPEQTPNLTYTPQPSP